MDEREGKGSGTRGASATGSGGDLTPRQRQIVEEVVTRQRAGAVPVMRELTTALAVERTGLNDSLERLRLKGYIEIEGGGRRGRNRVIRATDKARATVPAGGIPVLGCIPAGQVAPAVQGEVVKYLETLDDVFPDRKPDDFGLVVQGYSMYPELWPGDIVLLRPGIEPISGDVCGVYVGDDYCSTIKRLQFTPDRHYVTLEARNPEFESPSLPMSEVVVVGVAVHLVRPNFRRVD